MGMNSTIEYINKNLTLKFNRKLPIEVHNIDKEKIARMLGDLGFTVGAEVGVAQGHHSKILCENIPGLKLYCIDIWDRYKGYREYTNRIKKYYLEAQERLAPYNCVFMKMFSMEAIEKFEDKSLDFVYLDAAHDFWHFAEDLKWARKVRYGGVVFGHDYKRHRGGEGKYVVHVKSVVQAFCYDFAVDPWYHLKIPGQDSWMFVRQEGDLIDWP
jgi:hypothetical protein